MKKYLFLLLVLLRMADPTIAKTPNPHPIKQWYGVDAYELIFSLGNVETSMGSMDNKLRFSPFFNPQRQSHLNFTNHFGLYTGLGFRNVGLLDKLSLADESTVKLKQRAYAVGIPLAFKFGNMENGSYLALGAEAEYMFHYKMRIDHGGSSSKTSKWFSSDVNQFNPSLFADIRFHNGTFLRFKYYLNDFLKNKSTEFVLPDNGALVQYEQQESQLFYISIGTAFKEKKKKKLTKDDV